jgi:hypothetical protein
MPNPTRRIVADRISVALATDVVVAAYIQEISAPHPGSATDRGLDGRLGRRHGDRHPRADGGAQRPRSCLRPGRGHQPAGSYTKSTV